MKKIILVLIAVISLILILNLSLFAQNEKAANKSIYAELAGPGALISVNFDSRFFSDSQFGFGYRVGVGFDYGEYEHYYDEYDYENRTRYAYTIPVGLNYIFGKPNSPHAFEAGAGITFLPRKAEPLFFMNSDNGKASHIFSFFTFMYRRIPEDGGFSWRVGFTPIILTSGEPGILGTVSIGYVF